MAFEICGDWQNQNNSMPKLTKLNNILSTIAYYRGILLTTVNVMTVDAVAEDVVTVDDMMLLL
jgi:hypothetical protein